MLAESVMNVDGVDDIMNNFIAQNESILTATVNWEYGLVISRRG